ncbi:MAG: hypothetical protein C0417_06095 [Chlorobiaceae bacterium]|nr:hypothetical protein [Chlorobiaceae bacterium]
MKLYAILKEYREEHRLAQKQLAERLGITREYYSKIEKGSRLPSHNLLRKISVELNISLGHFFLPDQSLYCRLEFDEITLPLQNLTVRTFAI